MLVYLKKKKKLAHKISFWLSVVLSSFTVWLLLPSSWSLLHNPLSSSMECESSSARSKAWEGQWWSCRQGEGSPARRTYTWIYVTGCPKVLASSMMGQGLVPHADTWPASYACSVPVFVLHTTHNSVDSMRQPWWDGVGFVSASTGTRSNDMRSSARSQTVV